MGVSVRKRTAQLRPAALSGIRTECGRHLLSARAQWPLQSYGRDLLLSAAPALRKLITIFVIVQDSNCFSSVVVDAVDALACAGIAQTRPEQMAALSGLSGRRGMALVPHSGSVECGTSGRRPIFFKNVT